MNRRGIDGDHEFGLPDQGRKFLHRELAGEVDGIGAACLANCAHERKIGFGGCRGQHDPLAMLDELFDQTGGALGGQTLEGPVGRRMNNYEIAR